MTKTKETTLKRRKKWVLQYVTAQVVTLFFDGRHSDFFISMAGPLKRINEADDESVFMANDFGKDKGGREKIYFRK